MRCGSIDCCLVFLPKMARRQVSLRSVSLALLPGRYGARRLVSLAGLVWAERRQLYGASESTEGLSVPQARRERGKDAKLRGMVQAVSLSEARVISSSFHATAGMQSAHCRDDNDDHWFTLKSTIAIGLSHFCEMTRLLSRSTRYRGDLAVGMLGGII